MGKFQNIMEIIKTPLDGVLLLKPDVFLDERGFFFEAYNKKKFAGFDFNFEFVQDNISKSQKGTIRGLHYQAGENPQGKLCQVIAGRVLDVAVDIRFGSPTFGKYFAAELNDQNHHQLWMPPGFAHGFSVLSDIAIFHYKCTGYFSKPDERSFLFNDPDIGVQWRVENPIVSEKDLKTIPFKEITKDFIYSK
jgi:dTDP-4-dehydrorhamnose 3,5-epimerase